MFIAPKLAPNVLNHIHRWYDNIRLWRICEFWLLCRKIIFILSKVTKQVLFWGTSLNAPAFSCNFSDFVIPHLSTRCPQSFLSSCSSLHTWTLFSLCTCAVYTKQFCLYRVMDTWCFRMKYLSKLLLCQVETVWDELSAVLYLGVVGVIGVASCP